MYKVPFRRCYTYTFKDWLKQTFWCLVVIKIFPHLIDLESDSLKDQYVDNPELFHEQYRGFIRRANGLELRDEPK